MKRDYLFLSYNNFSFYQFKFSFLLFSIQVLFLNRIIKTSKFTKKFTERFVTRFLFSFILVFNLKKKKLSCKNLYENLILKIELKLSKLFRCLFIIKIDFFLNLCFKIVWWFYNELVIFLSLKHLPVACLFVFKLKVIKISAGKL